MVTWSPPQATGSRNTYVRRRVGLRTASRGETMLLRRVSKLPGPQPYTNPPDISADLHVTTASVVNGQAYFGLKASSAIGRLVVGDQLLLSATPGGSVLSTWVVIAMPADVATDSDGLVVLDNTGAPTLGTATVYNRDSLADSDGFRAVPVIATGNPDPTLSLGYSVTCTFLADQAVFGAPITQQAMTAMGWTEVDAVGVKIAAWNGAAVDPPQVDDLIKVNGRLRAIIAVSTLYGNGINFLYPVQAR